MGITDQLTQHGMVSYPCAIRDMARENERVMHQIANSSAEQAMLGDFNKAVDAVMNSHEAHQNQMTQLLSDNDKAARFAKVIFELLRADK